MVCDRFDAIWVLITSNGWPRVVTSNMFITAPTAMFDHDSFFGGGAILTTDP